MELVAAFRRQSTSYFWPKMKPIIRFLTHQISVFVFLQLITIAIAVLWVVFFVDQTAILSEAQRTFGASRIDSSYSLGLLIAGCILLGVMIVGTIFLFVIAQRQAALNRQHKTFLSSVTHELRSPLASLQLSVETMQSRQVPQEVAQKMLGMMTRDIARLLRLVDQILLSARLDRGMSLPDEPESFKIADVFEECLSSAMHLDQNLNERLSVSYPAELQLNTKRHAIAVIVGNLLENAIKYSPKGSPIQISCHLNDGDVVIKVKDQGLGLAKKDLRRIFRMFHRANRASKRAIPGTGLGLYIVSNVAKSLGGRCWAESPGPGEGSSFLVSVPRDFSGWATP